MSDPQPLPAERADSRGSRLTVQGWQNIVLSAMGALVLAGALAGGVLLNRTDHVMTELTATIGPARVAAYQLQAALRDQETAVRGYVLSADPQFLAPFYDGQRAENTAADDLRRLEAGHPDLIADLDAITRTATGWRTTYAQPAIASVSPGRPSVIDGGTIERGKVQFDELRRLFDVQNTHLMEARAASNDELDTVRHWRDGVLAAMVAAFFVTALLLAVLVRSALVRPLAALGASCRRITRGEFDQRIVPRGPKDIRRIAADVEDMRQRIVDELESSRAAREALDEQTVELRRSNAELEQFAYVASHDLQEPLRKVASFCQLLEKRYGDKLDERGVEYIAFAVDGAKRMQVLINDLLTFSRVGRLNASRTEVALDGALDTALANLTNTIEESGAQIVRPADGLPHVMGDATLLSMLWQNLVGNAVKFRREDRAPRVEITFEAGTGERADDWLFTVTDNGIGIPAEFVDKVFVIFQRLHGRDAYAGTGIGLALCKKIVEHHGGSIWIDTTYTDGTRFRFTMPTVVDAPAVLEGSAS
jgi:signal transduction histidine kinase